MVDKGHFQTVADRIREWQKNLPPMSERMNAVLATRSEAVETVSTSVDVCPACGGLGFYVVPDPSDPRKPGTPVTCECRKAEIQQRRLESVMSGETGIPAEYRGRTFETWDAMPESHRRGKEDARVRAEEFAATGEIKLAYKSQWGIALVGETGRGKSGLAASIMVRRTEMGINCLWIDFRKFLRLCYSTIQKNADFSYEEIVGVADSVPMLVWDDFADAEQRGVISDYVRNVVYDVISQRHREHLPTVITTNLTHDQLYEQFGDRIGDRILQMCYWQQVGNKRDANLRFAEGQ